MVRWLKVKSLNRGQSLSRASAGIEEASQTAGTAGQGAKVGAFAAIADGASEGQVRRVGASGMLAADDVVHLESEETVVFVEQAVFAEEVRSFGYEPAGFLANGAAHRRGVGGRGLWPVA